MRITALPWSPECVGTQGDPSNPVDLYELNNGYKRIAENLTREDAKFIAACVEAVVAFKKMQLDRGISSFDYGTRALEKIEKAADMVSVGHLSELASREDRASRSMPVDE